MNGIQTNKSAISTVTVTVSILASLSVSTICWLAYKSIQIPPELNTLTGTLCGYLTGVLSKTSPTETTRQPRPDGVPLGGAPTQVEVTNAETNPVPTTTEEKT